MYIFRLLNLRYIWGSCWLRDNRIWLECIRSNTLCHGHYAFEFL